MKRGSRPHTRADLELRIAAPIAVCATATQFVIANRMRMTIDTSSRQGMTIVASSGVSLLSWGHRLSVSIDAGATCSEVHVRVVEKYALNPFSRHRSIRIARKFVDMFLAEVDRTMV